MGLQPLASRAAARRRVHGRGLLRLTHQQRRDHAGGRGLERGLPHAAEPHDHLAYDLAWLDPVHGIAVDDHPGGVGLQPLLVRARPASLKEHAQPGPLLALLQDGLARVEGRDGEAIAQDVHVLGEAPEVGGGRLRIHEHSPRLLCTPVPLHDSLGSISLTRGDHGRRGCRAPPQHHGAPFKRALTPRRLHGRFLRLGEALFGLVVIVGR
eukprot:scaffold12312_cov63-Phaeocystis_antarctica.AAC.9